MQESFSVFVEMTKTTFKKTKNPVQGVSQKRRNHSAIDRVKFTQMEGSCRKKSPLIHGKATKDYEKFMSGKDRNKCIVAKQEELKSHQKNSTWELADIPEKREHIECKWVFKVKEDEEGVVQLETQDFSQKLTELLCSPIQTLTRRLAMSSLRS